jgi:hypothetical protein
LFDSIIIDYEFEEKGLIKEVLLMNECIMIERIIVKVNRIIGEKRLI